MSSIPSIAILASGRGSNVQALLESIEQGHLKAHVRTVLSDRKAPVLEIAKKFKVEGKLIPWPQHLPQKQRRAFHEAQLLAALKPTQNLFLVLAGYMRILSKGFLSAFRSQSENYFRVLNIHPSLLPAFPGLHSYAQAFHYGVKVTGVTIHLVDPSLDAGPILAQEAFSVSDCKNAEEVEQRGLKIEHRLYTQTLAWVLKKHFTLDRRRVTYVESRNLSKP